MIKNKIKKLLSVLLSTLLIISILPAINNTMIVHAESDKIVVGLGSDGIMAPKPGEAGKKWTGSFVWYGAYDGVPVRYRVLAPSTTIYGGTTIFLDCDRVLYEEEFDRGDYIYGGIKPNEWFDSDIMWRLNGSSFLDKSKGFTTIEKAAIAESTVDTHDITVGSSIDMKFPKYTALNGEKIFLLDIEDILNTSYGYSSDISWSDGWGYTIHAGVKNYNIFQYKSWWLRSPYGSSIKEARCVLENGEVNCSPVYSFRGVSPAFNIDLDSVIFSSLVSGTAGEEDAEYKLTLNDDDMKITLSTDKNVTIASDKITVPYTVSGVNSDNATQVSILILDKEYTLGNTNEAKIKYYGKLNTGGTFSKNGTGTIDFPSDLKISGWGNDYHVYLLAEDVNGEKETDYASEPIEINYNKVVSYYDVWVGNTQITNLNMASIACDTGKASFDPDTDTLTFDNATVKKSSKREDTGLLLDGCNIITGQNLTIKGKVNLESGYIGIGIAGKNISLNLDADISVDSMSGGITATGLGGKIEIIDGNYDIKTDEKNGLSAGIASLGKSIEIKSGSIKASGADYGIIATGTEDDPVQIKISGGTVEAHGDTMAIVNNEYGIIDIADDLAINEPKNGMIQTVNIGEDKYIVATDSSGVAATSIKISKRIYNVSFESNGGSGTMDKVSMEVGSDYILPECTFTAPEGKKFDKWDVGKAGESIKVTSDITIKPVWKDKPVEQTPTPKPTATSDTNPTPSGPSVRDKSDISPENPAKISDVEKTILNIKDEKDAKGSTFTLLKAKGIPRSKKSVKLSWSKVPGAEKYMIYGNKCGRKNKYKYITTVTGTSYTAKKLKKGTYYKYTIVAVKGDEAIATSKTIHVTTDGGKKGNNTKVKLSKTKLSLNVGKSKKIRATLKSKKKVSIHRKVVWESDNVSIATVKNGKITAVGKGTCYVYAYAQNGVSAKIKVTVK